MSENEDTLYEWWGPNERLMRLDHHSVARIPQHITCRLFGIDRVDRYCEFEIVGGDRDGERFLTTFPEALWIINQQKQTL